MVGKIYKSTQSARSIEYQDNILYPALNRNLATFVDGERDELVRPSRRSEQDRVHAASAAIFAEDEKDLIRFLNAARKKNLTLVCHEENFVWAYQTNKTFVDVWRTARKSGAAQRGASASAANRKAKSAEGIAKIKSKWLMPSCEHSTAGLLKEAGLSLNTVKAVLGSRPIAQHNYRAFMKRKLRKLQSSVKK